MTHDYVELALGILVSVIGWLVNHVVSDLQTRLEKVEEQGTRNAGEISRLQGYFLSIYGPSLPLDKG